MRIKVPLQIIELEDENFHLVIKGEFTDGESVNWIIDTGASKSVFDKNLSTKYEILKGDSEEVHSAGIGEQPIETSLGRLQSFFFGRLKIENPKMAILDLARINDLYSKSANLKIAGLIGGDFLMRHKAKIDYKKRVLELSRK